MASLQTICGTRRRLAYLLSRDVEERARDERLRLARELHDGVAQELALIALHAGVVSGERARAIEEAAARALEECRVAIAELRGAPRPSSTGALAAALDTLAAREGIAIETRFDPAVEVGPEEQFELLRIITESIRNAVHHGRASRATVELWDEGGLVLRVSDNGTGFDVDRVPEGRYGILGMHERARELGGALSVSSRPGGTEIELALMR